MALVPSFIDRFLFYITQIINMTISLTSSSFSVLRGKVKVTVAIFRKTLLLL